MYKTTIQIFLLLVFTSSLTLYGCSEEPKSAVSEKPIIKAEMIVSPIKDKFLVACLSSELLDKLMEHLVREEKTKASAMFDNYDCVQIPETEKFKVLSVRGSKIEIINAQNTNSNGLWTYSESMQPIK
ncbi:MULTISPECIES: hypothetical protein [unclassified Acinetobacter]|uniref:hypothetical protein n=1 Tax=unclassified Acinetobacter TaxID=196816 RepID=UPI000A352EB6|nr:hypothetical protein [Acinetobacter sp. ANC 4218]OTG73592.1 hypothetical protein B9T38_04090 [Acinetobacter sp. ANC 4218]